MGSDSSSPLAPHYLDGIVSVPQSVALSLTDQSLLISKDGINLAIWPCSKIFVKEDWLDGVGTVLGHKDNSDVSLVIYNQRQFQNIQARLSRKHRTSFILPHKYRHLSVMAVGAVAVSILIFPLLHYLASVTTYLVPHSLEQKLGNLVVEDMQDMYGTCDNKEALAHLKKITDRLVKASDYKKAEVDIYLLKSSTANAFSIPGHKIVVLSGFLNDAQSENEIAAVMAHEMGHMIKRDSLEAFIEAQGIGVITGLIGSSGSYGGVAQFTSLLQSMDYSRKKEHMADEFGADLLVKAGYAPSGLTSFLARLDKKEHPLLKGEAAQYEKYLEFLSTHPATKERVQKLKKYDSIKTYKSSLTQTQFDQLKNACKSGLKSGQ